jgi:hypothetical protein
MVSMDLDVPEAKLAVPGTTPCKDRHKNIFTLLGTLNFHQEEIRRRKMKFYVVVGLF